MANPEQPRFPPPAETVSIHGGPAPDATANAEAGHVEQDSGPEVARAAMLFGASLLLCLVAYVVLAVGNIFRGV